MSPPSKDLERTFAEILKISKKVKIEHVAATLGISVAELFQNMIEWAKALDFTIDGEFIITGTQDMKEEKAYSVGKIRENYPNAYRKWTKEEDDLLHVKFSEGYSVAELCTQFQRQPGGIRSRLDKLGLVEPPSSKKILRLKKSLSRE